MGELAASAVAGDVLVSLGLGSCIGLALFDRRLGVAGLAHIVLPASSGNTPAGAYKFADIAVPELIDRVVGAGGRRALLEAALVGGASMFAVVDATLEVGVRNEAAVRDLLAAQRINVIAAETGGDRGRTIRVHVGSSRVTVREAGGVEHDLVDGAPAAVADERRGGPVLSEDAIAALVDAARDGRLPEEKPAPQRRRRMRAVDFTRPTKFTSEQERRIGRTLEAFSRTASTRLSAELRVPLELEVLTSTQLTWANAHAQVPANSTAAIFEVEPIGTRMLLSTESTLLLARDRAAARRVDRRRRQGAPHDRHRPGAGPSLLRAPAGAADADLDRRRGALAASSRPSTSTWRPRRWSRCPSRRCR